MFHILILYLIYFLLHWKMGSLEENLPGPVKGKHKKKDRCNEGQETNKSDKKASHHRRSSHKCSCSGDASSNSRAFLPVQNYCFNPCNYVWSTGLYCSFEEDLNLESWTHFESCKSIWEKASGAKGNTTGVPKSSRRNVGWKRRGVTMVSRATDTSELEAEGIDSGLLPCSRTQDSVPLRDVATSPACTLVLDDGLSDVSLSLEPISSSSLHSSSECEEEA